jgi:hypothetical protein
MGKLVEDFSTDAKTLTMAGHYDHNLTLSMLQIFLQAGGDGSAGEAFRFPLSTIKMKLDSAWLAIALKEKAAAQAYLSKDDLLYTDICKSVENEYRKLTDASEWSPAKHAQDSKAAPAQFAAIAAQATTLTDIQIMALGCNLVLPLVSRLERAITVRSPELKNKQGRNNARGANRGPSSGTNQLGQLV